MVVSIEKTKINYSSNSEEISLLEVFTTIYVLKISSYFEVFVIRLKDLLINTKLNLVPEGDSNGNQQR